MPDERINQVLKPQSGDRNDNYVAKQDQPHQKKRDKDIAKAEREVDAAVKRDQGIR
jgi:hypothetical protein